MRYDDMPFHSDMVGGGKVMNNADFKTLSSNIAHERRLLKLEGPMLKTKRDLSQEELQERRAMGRALTAEELKTKQLLISRLYNDNEIAAKRAHVEELLEKRSQCKQDK